MKVFGQAIDINELTSSSNYLRCLSPRAMDSGSVSESAAVGEGEGWRERRSEWCAELSEHANGYAEVCLRHCHTGAPPVRTADLCFFPIRMCWRRVICHLLTHDSRSSLSL